MPNLYLSPYSRRGRRTFFPLAGLLLCLGGMAGCSQDDLGGGPDESSGAKALSYVRLDFAMPSGPAERAVSRPMDNPTGGEGGDGSEAGQSSENEVTDAVAFFFQAPTGANADAATPVTPVYFPSLTATSGPGNGGAGTGIDAVYTTGSTPTELLNGTYQVLVVANPGTEAWWNEQGLTLGQVRDHIQHAAWQETAGAYSAFVMASASDARLVLNSNPESEPATTTVSVERLAARVDYAAEEESFTCTDPAYTGATVQITGAAIVNDFTAGSYLLKRVTAGTDDLGSWTYLGEETADEATDAATNYVLDPLTAEKTSGNSTFVLDGTTYSSRADLYGTYLPSGSQDPNDWEALVTEGARLSGQWGERDWRRAGYTLENVTRADESGRAYSTAVVFKATFHPAGLKNYRDGATFFAWGAQLYPSMEDVMAAAYGAAWTDIQSAMAAATTWDEVREVANRLLDNDPSGYDDYINGLLAADYATGDLDDAERGTLAWTYYMSHVTGYTAKHENGVWSVHVDQISETTTREYLARFGIRTYEDATCYYTWFVRHANDGDDETNGPMEYAIVRNNVYKLLVTGIYSLGDDVPGESEPIVRVYVNDWLLLPAENIEM